MGAERERQNEKNKRINLLFATAFTVSEFQVGIGAVKQKKNTGQVHAKP